ncbi:dUTPase-like protein [Whalleya microplaca]|nr:dUTPase-like protein [Whalleya microplaca]
MAQIRFPLKLHPAPAFAYTPHRNPSSLRIPHPRLPSLYRSKYLPTYSSPHTSLRTIMTTDAITSPPTSPPAKRVKTTEQPTSSTMAPTTTEETPVPKIEQSPPLLIKKLSEKARLPTRGSAFAAGYDVYASQATVVPARGKALVETDISIAVPAGTYGRIAPRSGLAAKHFIDTGAGVIDADYRGPVKVLLFNHSEADFAVAEGERVAQLVVERIYTPDVVEVAELDASVRGAGGFGSTGTN